MEVKGTLKYRKVQRTPQTGENAGKKKWYAAAVTDREVDFEGFVSHIYDHGSPYSRGTIHGVLMDALDHLQELILDGKSVRLSDLGLFSIGMSSKAEDAKEKVTAAQRGGRAPDCEKHEELGAILEYAESEIGSTAAISAPTERAPQAVVLPVAALNRAAATAPAKAVVRRAAATGLNKALA